MGSRVFITATFQGDIPGPSGAREDKPHQDKPHQDKAHQWSAWLWMHHAVHTEERKSFHTSALKAALHHQEKGQDSSNELHQATSLWHSHYHPLPSSGRSGKGEGWLSLLAQSFFLPFKDPITTQCLHRCTQAELAVGLCHGSRVT